MTNASDYLISRDPWLPKLGSRSPGQRIEDSHREAFPPILRGRPTYDRLPGAAEAYNKENNTFISQGTILIPEVQTIVSSSEDIFFRTRFPDEYTNRDYISGSTLGPGSAAVLVLNTLKPLLVGTNVTDLELLSRSCVLFWGNSAIRDNSGVSKDTIVYDGMILTLPLSYSGWIYINGLGNLVVAEELPDGILNLTDNVWCNSNDDSKICARRITDFGSNDKIFIDKLDIGRTPQFNNLQYTSLEPLLHEVSPLYKFTVNSSGVLTQWEDYRRFNKTFDAPIAKWLTDHADNFLIDKKEQIDTFFDDYLYPDSIGLFLLKADGPIRSSYKPENVRKIIDSWDFGLITRDTLETHYGFLTNTEIDDLINYDTYTHKILDWVAQHFGFYDNPFTQYKHWHNGSGFGEDPNDFTNGRVYYTIAEKRTLLRNAYTQDLFQDYNAINKEFVFTRFPFTLYNRLKPSNWEGLLKARGTEKALEFMFDTMGLHGYESYTLQPRYETSIEDLDVPLSLIKYTNKPVVGYVKELSPSGKLQDKIPLTINDGAYSSSGVFKIGETVFADNHDREYVIRAPFAWERPSKNWNRVKEITNTYANESQVNVGYYYYVAGKSAIGECVFVEDNRYKIEYQVSIISRLLSLSHPVSNLQYQPYAIMTDEENTYIRRYSVDPAPTSGSERLTNPLIEFPEYLFIDPIVNEGSLFWACNKDITADLRVGPLPLLYSTDKGSNFEFSQAIINGMDPSYRIKRVLRMKLYDNSIFLIGIDNSASPLVKLLQSRDNGESFSIINGLPVGTILDFVYDNEEKIQYIAMDSGVWFKYDNQEQWHSLLTPYPINSGSLVKAANIIVNESGIYLHIIESPGVSSNVVSILYSPNLGANKFKLYQSPAFPPTSNHIRTQSAPLSSNSTKIEHVTIVKDTQSVVSGSSIMIVRNFQGENFIDVTSVFIGKVKDLILSQDLSLDNYFPTSDTFGSPVSSAFGVVWKEENNIFTSTVLSDVLYNFNTSRFDMLITLSREEEVRGFTEIKQESIIVSFSDLGFGDLKIVKRGLTEYLDTDLKIFSSAHHFVRYDGPIDTRKISF